MTEIHAKPNLDAATSSALLQVSGVTKVYGGRGAQTTALAGLNLTVDAGEFVAIMGPSGSGKSTLLNCIATIDTVTEGRIVVNGQDLARLGRRDLARFRRDQMGFIFQDALLLDTLTGFENIALALTIKGTPTSEVASRVQAIAATLGVSGVLEKHPAQMSGGQRQRIAAARALVGDPKIVLADEPTGALDSRNATLLLKTLANINRDRNVTILMVTHDAYAASFAERAAFIKDGTNFTEVRRGTASRQEFFGQIMDVVTLLGGEVGDAS